MTEKQIYKDKIYISKTKKNAMIQSTVQFIEVNRRQYKDSQFQIYHLQHSPK